MTAKLPSDGGDVRPVPDPTILTTAALLSGLAALREILETRLDGMDRAIKLLQAVADKIPAHTDEKIASLREIQDEKFRSIQTQLKEHDTRAERTASDSAKIEEEKFRSIQVQFSERDTRAEQTSKDSKVAVDAALQAAKEAVGEQNKSSALAIAKSETATVKQIDQQGLLIQSMTKGFDDKIDDVKERLTRIEGKGEGVQVTQATQEKSSNYLVAVVGMIIGALIGIAGILLALFKH